MPFAPCLLGRRGDAIEAPKRGSRAMGGMEMGGGAQPQDSTSGGGNDRFGGTANEAQKQKL